MYARWCLASEIASDRNREWNWDYPKQKWYHLDCDAYASEHRCDHCDARVPDSFTWGDVMDYIHEKGYDQDEYFSYGFFSWDEDGTAARDKFLDSQVFDDPEVASVAVYWVKGGSEGWYVHVDQHIGQPRGDSWAETDCKRCGKPTPHRHKNDENLEIYHGRGRLVGKFWDMERAMEVTAALTEYIWTKH